MKEYEVLQESMTSCGGSKYSVKEFLEVEAESPEAWVKENGRWTILESAKLLDALYQSAERKEEIKL